MKRFILTLLVTTLLATTNPVWAEPSSPPPVISPLSKGQQAPFTGVLLSPEAVAQVIAQQDTAQAAQKLAVQHQADLDAAELKFQIDQLTTTCTADKTILQAQIDNQKKQIQIFNDQLKKTTGGPPASLWLGVGAVGGVVATLLTVFAVTRVTK